MASQNFDWFDTPDPTERGFVISAGEMDQDCVIPDFLGGTVLFSDCADWITREAKVISALQGYRLVHTAKAGQLRRNFYFTRVLSAEEIAAPFKSSYEVDPSFYWPPVLLHIEQYPKTDGTYTLKPIYKESYSGPTRMLVEEYFSPVAHSIAVPEIMRPLGVDDVVRVNAPFDYVLGSLSLRACLHGNINLSLPLNPPVVDGAVTYLNAFLHVPATNMTDWPATLVADDRQREVLGGWLRRKVTAIKPL